MKRKGGVSNEISGVALNSLEYMERAHKEGATVLMIDSQMFDDIVSYSYKDLFTKSHWIVYEGGLKFLNESNNTVTDLKEATRIFFNFATFFFGGAPSNSYENLENENNISVSCFKSTFYGLFAETICQAIKDYRFIYESIDDI